MKMWDDILAPNQIRPDEHFNLELLYESQQVSEGSRLFFHKGAAKQTARGQMFSADRDGTAGHYLFCWAQWNM